MYYPEQRGISSYTTIRREVRLPDEAMGSIRVTEGQRVDIRDTVVQGMIPNGYVIIDVGGFFGLRNLDKLESLLKVSVRDVVQKQDVLAGKNVQRGKRLYSPVRGVVTQINQGRIVIQKAPTVIDLEAGVRGKVVEVLGDRGVMIESVGVRVQGFWGNNRNVIASIRIGPDGDMAEKMSDSLERRFAGSIILLRRSINRSVLDMMTEQGFAGIIAPSMDSRLRPLALQQHAALILTEGFGNMPMSSSTFSLLAEFDGSQVTLDALMSSRWESRRPEVVVNVPSRDRTPERPGPGLVLKTGMTVRLAREPKMGSVGKIADLPEMPILLENGLRVNCAQIQLLTGHSVTVPLANLEVLGQ